MLPVLLPSSGSVVPVTEKHTILPAGARSTNPLSFLLICHPIWNIVAYVFCADHS